MLEARRATDGTVMTREERQRFWSAVARGEYPEAFMGLRLRASAILGKSQGDFVEQQEIRSDIEYRLKWEGEDDESTPAKREATLGRAR